MFRATFTVCAALVALVSGLQRRFDGYELIRFEVNSPHEADFLIDLGAQHVQLDFWTDPVPGSVSNVLVPPTLLAQVKSQAKDNGLTYHVINSDIQSLVEAGSERTPVSAIRRAVSSGYVIDHHNYHSYDQIVKYVYDLQSTYPNNVVVSRMNWFTHEGRPVSLVKVSSSPGSSKPVVIMEAGIHAREWISPAANLYAIERLLKDYHSGDATATQMLNNYDWWLVPVTNPDGYEYSRNSDRMWRKNRRPISSRCTGVDLNRNYDSKFGQVGVSHDCRDSTYPGTAAFSEPETSNMRDLANSLGHRLQTYLSVHSYSQLLIVPWGNVNYLDRPANYVELDRVGKQMQAAIYNTHGKTYTYGTAWQVLNYAASGAAEDWALITHPGIYAYCYELRPDQYDHRAFVLPASEIIATGEEYYNSLAVMAREMRHISG